MMGDSMAAYEIKSVREEPVYIVTFNWSFELERDSVKLLTEISEILDTVVEPIAIIYDMRQMRISIGDLVPALGFSTRSGSDLSEHPMMAKLVCVTTNEFLRLATSALRGAITTATNIEVAVNAARHALAANLTG
jgi:hypothetical protein